MALNPVYAGYTAELMDGEEQTGILVAENATHVTLQQAQGISVTIPRAQMRQLRANGRSLMLEGLEAGLTPQELRDVIALIQKP
jgi:putative heme-binding domain-containing protein